MERQTQERWAAIVADAEAAGVPHAQVAERHQVSLPALKYHLYKTRKEAGGKLELPPFDRTGLARLIVGGGIAKASAIPFDSGE